MTDLDDRRMRFSVAAVRELVTGLTPGDELEAEHRSATLRWLANTDDEHPEATSRRELQEELGITRLDRQFRRAPHRDVPARA